MKASLSRIVVVWGLLMPMVAFGQSSMLRIVCADEDVGAEVKINGKFRGECPVDIKVAPERMTISVIKGDREFVQEIRMGENSVKKLEAVLGLNAAAKVALRAKEEEIFKDLAMVPIPGRPYEFGKFTVTQRVWQAVMGTNPSHFKDCGGTCPVENISWNEAQEFIKRLNVKTGKVYRLPFASEWIDACRGGTGENYYFCGSNDMNATVWYGDNSGGKTHPVGQKQPNPFGLFDMLGNVHVWLQNCDGSNCDRREMIGWSYSGFGVGEADPRGGYKGIHRKTFESNTGSTCILDCRERKRGIRLVRDLP